MQRGTAAVDDHGSGGDVETQTNHVMKSEKALEKNTRDARVGSDSPCMREYEIDDIRRGRVERTPRHGDRRVRYSDELDRAPVQDESVHHRHHEEAPLAQTLCYAGNTYPEQGDRESYCGAGRSRQMENSQHRSREELQPADAFYHERSDYPGRQGRQSHGLVAGASRGHSRRSDLPAPPARPLVEAEGCQRHGCGRWAHQGRCEKVKSRPTDERQWSNVEAPLPTHSLTQSHPEQFMKEEKGQSPDHDQQTFRGHYRAKPKKIPPYSGAKPLRDYLTLFEETAKLNGWVGEQKALELATNLCGDAMAVLTDMPIGERSSYECVVARLKERFEPEGMEDRYLQELNGRKRQPRETIQALEAAIYRLVDMALPNADKSTKNRMRVDRFTKALGDFELASFIRSTGPQTLDQAAKAATNFEVFRDAYKESQPQPVMRKQEFVQTNHETMTKPQIEALMRTMLATEVAKAGGQGNKDQANKGRGGFKKACWGCGEVGHFKADCPTNPYKTPKGTKSEDKKQESTSADAQVPGNEK